MPAERVSMRKIREALRLTHALGMSRRRVSEATGIGKTAVGEYVRRAAVAGLSWPIPDEIDDTDLERRLFPLADAGWSAPRTDPDWSHIHTEMKRRGVTLALLWQEYRGGHAQGYAYSCYVAAKFMLRLLEASQRCRRVPWPARNISRRRLASIRLSGMPSMMAKNVAEVAPSSR